MPRPGGMDAVLGSEPDLAALRFRRLATRMAILMMQAAMEPVPALADHSRMLGRHFWSAPDIDASYLTPSTASSASSPQERAEYASTSSSG